MANELLRALDQVASEPTWKAASEVALAALPAALGAPALGIYLLGSNGLEVLTRTAEDSAVDRYLRCIGDADRVLSRALEHALPVHERDVYTADEWRTSALYECAAGPAGYTHYLVAPLFGADLSIIGSLTVARREHDGGFTSEDLLRVSVASNRLSMLYALSQVRTNVVIDNVHLTPREVDVAELALRGFPNAELAGAFGVSVNMIKKHLKAIYTKLGVSTRAELAWVLCEQRDRPIMQRPAVANEEGLPKQKLRAAPSSLAMSPGLAARPVSSCRTSASALQHR
jgi:DNA-binding CsgD family transcriptional regulator